MSDAIRVGLVGFGYASKTFHAPLIGGTPEYGAEGGRQQRRR